MTSLSVLCCLSGRKQLTLLNDFSWNEKIGSVKSLYLYKTYLYLSLSATGTSVNLVKLNPLESVILMVNYLQWFVPTHQYKYRGNISSRSSASELLETLEELFIKDATNVNESEQKYVYIYICVCVCRSVCVGVCLFRCLCISMEKGNY